MLYPSFTQTLLAYPHHSKRLIVAFSGGVDSRVLLELVARFIAEHPDYQAHAVYVHHGLSAHADEWGIKCQRWAESYGISFTLEYVQLETGSRVSVEQAARQARYHALSTHMNTGDTLLTAQHADDQIETFMLALKRGSGPAGLAAMPQWHAFEQGFHARPLLTTRRAEIVQFALTHQLDWVEDESNQDTRYDRNFLRHQIVPELEQRWPGVVAAVSRSAQLCGEQEGLLAELLGQTLNQAIQSDKSLLLPSPCSKSLGFALIRQWLKSLAVVMPSLAQLQQIWSSVVHAKEDANPKLCWSQYEIRRYQGRLYVLEQWDDISSWQQTIALEQTYQLPQNLGKLTLTLQGEEPLLRQPKPDETVSVRFHYQGDAIKPLGRSGSRKIKKLYQEYQVPSWMRNRTPLIFYNDKLVAVVGIFVVAEFSGSDITIALENEF
ncbi:tRNA lysidine(34) synthetase TilS [Photobacterium damselae]